VLNPTLLTMGCPRLCDTENVEPGFEHPCCNCHRKVFIHSIAVLFVPLDVQVACFQCVLKKMPGKETINAGGDTVPPMNEMLAERRAELRAERDERVVTARRGHGRRGRR
jgi:hypothetical protein